MSPAASVAASAWATGAVGAGKSGEDGGSSEEVAPLPPPLAPESDGRCLRRLGLRLRSCPCCDPLSWPSGYDGRAGKRLRPLEHLQLQQSHDWLSAASASAAGESGAGGALGSTAPAPSPAPPPPRPPSPPKVLGVEVAKAATSAPTVTSADVPAASASAPASTAAVSSGSASAAASEEAEVDEEVSGAFVDVHCHLEEVLAAVRRHAAAPSLCKYTVDLSEEERKHWRVLGWLRRSTSSSAATEAEKVPRAAAGAGETSVWCLRWRQLGPVQRQAAENLGWAQATWDSNEWVLPRGVPWPALPETSRAALIQLGESRESWQAWTARLSSASSSEPSGDASSRMEEAEEAGEAGEGAAEVAANINDSRRWSQLSAAEQAAATALGLSKGTWEETEAADLEATIRDLFGPRFEGCLTQGCDPDSIDAARDRARAHPSVFASFGCHPKSSYCYDDAFEARLISAFEACGPKAVAWGEFGLDYSHPYFGKLGNNRRLQRAVFARQLQLAVGRGLPLVIHSRDADADTLRLMRRWVPKNWRVHIHAFRGGLPLMEALLTEWSNVYFGFCGLLSLKDEGNEALALRCPLERLLLETDAPYLPVGDELYWHPGLIPRLARDVAQVKGLSTGAVLAAARANARKMYGF